MADGPSTRPEAPGLRGLIIDILVQERRWLEKLPGLEALARKIVQGVLTDARVWPGGKPPGMAEIEVSLCFADDRLIRGLNAEFRGRDKPTNVLSFPSGEVTGEKPAGLHLGDIVLALGVISREAGEQEKEFSDHTAHLVLHGLLHLLGFDHDDDEAAWAMEALEIDLLKTFGIANPYE